MLGPRTDFWTVGILPALPRNMQTAGSLKAASAEVVWLPDPGPWKYLADPFALTRNERMHVFVEAYDYRTKHGLIERHEYDADFIWQGRELVLKLPHHLSYPYLIEQDGEVLMVPETHQANEIAIYRARDFPNGWTKERILLRDVAGADASLIRFQDMWWMFYTIVGKTAQDQRELHVAYANNLFGPWRNHPLNPILSLADRSGARPGGNPFIDDKNKLTLPVQDCSSTYGGAIRFLRFDKLTPSEAVFTHSELRLTGDLLSSTHTQGMHTFSRCDNAALFDVKRISRSWQKYLVSAARKMRKT